MIKKLKIIFILFIIASIITAAITALLFNGNSISFDRAKTIFIFCYLVFLVCAVLMAGIEKRPGR